MSYQEFHPEFRSSRVAPHASSDGTQDFPYDEVFDRLDGTQTEPETSKPTFGADHMQRFFLWIKDVRATDQRAIKSIGIRYLAALWVVNPKYFDDAPAHMVAKSFGLSPEIFSRRAADFSREFGLQNHCQAHDWRRKAKSKGAVPDATE